jgi:hypothetical protein
MSNAHSSCPACGYFKTIGEKGFCFKRRKVMAAPPPHCDDFKSTTRHDKKKRWILEKRDGRKGGAEVENIELTEKPVGTEGFRLPKKSTTMGRSSIDTEGGEEMKFPPGQEEFDQGQKLFLAILVGGVIILFAVLLVTGVF